MKEIYKFWIVWICFILLVLIGLYFYLRIASKRAKKCENKTSERDSK